MNYMPIQIINNRPSCNGFNGNLNSFQYGLKPEAQQNMLNIFDKVGLLANNDAPYSPFYSNPQLNDEYVKFLDNVIKCRAMNKERRERPQ